VTQTTRIIDGSTYTVSQSYDALGRITVENFPQDNDGFCYSYNNAGWLQSVGAWVSPNCVWGGQYVDSITYNARGQKLTLAYANGLATSWSYFPNNFRLQTRQTLAGGTHTTVALASWTKSWTTQEPLPPPSGFVNLYAGGICVVDGAGACVGGDATVEAIGGSVLGYIKTASGAGTVPAYQSTRYVNAGGSPIAWGLSLAADGPLAGYLSTTAPDSQSALVPFVQSNGLLLQGITGTPSAYLWSVQTGTVNHTDHYYLTTGQPPNGYISEGTTAYIDGASSGGTVALVRYNNSTTGHNYYSTVNDPPSGFGGGTTVGYLHATGGAGLIELYRHYNATTGDYLITTSSAPPGGYVMQALLGYGHSSGVTSTQQNLAYTYDLVGNLKTVTDAVWTASRSFNYDDLNRMTQATGNFGVNQALVTQDYTYDAIGNILSKAGVTYCYGYMAGCTDSNRLSGVKTTSDGATYSYDANGNISSGAGRTYIWNGDNRLDQVTGPGGSAVMTYDYTGIRIKKTGSSGTSYFPFTGYEVQGGTVTKYVRIGNEIIASKQGATKRFYHNDHLGGVNIISDINGNQVQLTEYDPWGKVSLSVNAVDLTHRFTGQELDSESDVYYYGGRYYSQGLGRFISPDPFAQDPDNPQNLNRYSYVLNLPQNYVDPSGYFWDEIGSFFSGIGSFFSSFSAGSYQSQVSQAQQNNAFMSGVFNNPDLCSNGACGSYKLEMHKYATIVEWDGMLDGPFGKYSIFDGTKYESGLAKPSFNEYDAALLLVSGPAASRATTSLRELGSSITKFFYDPRRFGKISSEYWAAHGPANGSSLHHWLFPQKATWVPEGIRNAGFNLLTLPPARGVFHETLGLNQWMGFAQNWGSQAAFQANLMSNAIRVGIPSMAATSGYLGYEGGSLINERLSGEK